MKHIVLKLKIAGILLLLTALPAGLQAQAFSTTTVQGTVYLANGAPGSGTLQVSWPAFTTAASQAVAAGRTNVSIGADGFVSIKLAPNAGSAPAGLYYTAVYHLSDGTTSTEYWVVPAAAQASIAQVRATVMPAAQAVQAVSKTYVDQAVQLAAQSQLTASGGNLTGPLFLNGDPSVPTQAATKHYVDNQLGQALSINGGAANGPLTAVQLGASYQADQFGGSDFGARLQACVNALNATYGGTCDARNFMGTLGMASNLTIGKANVTVDLPCATVATASQIVVPAGTRNVTLHGCSSRGTTAASGNQGGTVFLYSGSAAMIQAGDPTYAADTMGFHLDNVVINTTPATAGTAQAIAIWRAQELHLESLYLLGNANQTGITLDGTGNYTGGTLTDIQIGGFQTALNAIGHQTANAAITDWVNASTFIRLHINCATSGGNPIAGTTGINLRQGDGNMFSGGDVESCATALHLGPNAQNNTIVGLRNENSTYQVVADAGSAYNNWMTGGTMFTGKLTDNGTRNSFLDTFHRSFNGLNGDWYGSQQDATVINHFRLGIGTGNERGLQDRYQTDAGYRWTMGLTDATAGAQFYQVLDELNNVNRLSIGQYNSGQGSSNNQTVINAAGTGAVVLNGSSNAGSGGVIFGSGGPASSTVGTIDSAGNAQFNGTLRVGGATTFTGSPSVKNQVDAEVDYFLQAGATAPQKESLVYKDWNGASQWYLVKDASNNFALNSAVGGVDSFKAYQSTNSGDTYIDAASNTGVVRVNYEPGSGSAFNVYGGGSGNLYASFNGATGIKFPGLAASNGKNCVQIDNSGYLSNTGTACAGSSVGNGNAGQIAYYPSNGSTLAGMAAVPVTSGGTGATSASAALASLGGLPATGGTLSGPLAGNTAAFSGEVQAQSVTLGSDDAKGHQAASANAAKQTYQVTAYGAVPDAAFQNGTTYYGIAMTSGSTTATFSGGLTLTSADAGKWVGAIKPTAQPFATVAYTGQPNFTTNNVAQIISVTDATHAVMSKPAINTFTATAFYGTDNSPAFNACAQAAYSNYYSASNSGGGVCIVPPGQYLFATSSTYQLVGAFDDGTASGLAGGGSGAGISCSLGSGATAGQIVSCSVTNGGHNYTPDATLPVSWSGGCAHVAACGFAQVTASTDSTGAVDDVTIVQHGYGYVSTPTFTVLPIGPDGAAATATVSGGAIASVNVTSGGGGYLPNSTVPWYAMVGSSGCANLNNVSAGQTPWAATGTAPTDANGHVINPVTIGTNATGCTSAPTIVIGGYACNSGTAASPVWEQCRNIPPIQQYAQPLHVFLPKGVSFVGQTGSRGGGTSLDGTWDGVTVDNNQPALIGGWLAFSDLKDLQLHGAMVGAEFPGYNNYAKMQDVWFDTAVGLITQISDIGVIYDNLTFQSPFATWVNGGWWSTRKDFINEFGGYMDSSSIHQIISRPYSYQPLSAKFDDWFDQNYWLSSASANSTDFLETCKFPAAANQRQSGHALGDVNHGANTHCYPGITGFAMENLARGARGSTQIVLDGLTGKGLSRNIFCCNIGAMKGTGITCESCTQISNDPYRNAAKMEGAIKTIEGGISVPGATPLLDGISYTGSTASWMLFSIPQQGSPTTIAWKGLQQGATNAQPSANPGFPNVIQFPYGLNAGTSTSAPCPGNGLCFFGFPAGAYALGGDLTYSGDLGSAGSTLLGPDGSTHVFDANNTNLQVDVPLSTKNGIKICNPSSPASCASVSFGGSTNPAVTVPDAASTTVQGAGSATAGNCLQYVDTSGVQHYTPCSAGGGSVSGPATSTAGHAAVWSNANGTLLADAGSVPAVAPAVYDFKTSAAASGLGCTGTNPYTCRLPAVCTTVKALVISGAGGGGSGATCANASASCFGGGGGSGASMQDLTIDCAELGGPGATFTVGVGAGGAGGNAQASNSSSGSSGGNGGNSSVSGAAGYISIAATANPGNWASGAPGGSGGTATAGTGASGTSFAMWNVCGGANGGSGAGGGVTCQAVFAGPAGGAGGGGLVNGAMAAGGGQNKFSSPATRSPGLNASTVTGGNSGGGNGQTPAFSTVIGGVIFPYAAEGGTGGGSNCAGTGGRGGNGMFPGGGGAGGGAACNGSSSGAGGNGADGLVRLIIQ